MKKTIRTLIILLLSGFLWFYIFLPPINIHSPQFWLFAFAMSIELIILLTFSRLISWFEKKQNHKHGKIIPEENKIPLGFTVKATISVAVFLLAYLIITNFIYSPLIMAKRYASRIDIHEVPFSSIPSYSFNQTAIIDRDSAQKLGDKVMGEITDLVSQFQVSEEYSQISYQNGTYRVTPLAYDDFIKYFKNRSSGIPGYILVNTTTGETKLKRLENKMRYVPSAMFNEKLMRKLRFQYPFTIFGNPTFEIDEEGNPYYICSTFTYSGVNSLRRVNGVILFNPVTGESQKYQVEDAPTWVDRIFPEKLVHEELNDYGLYQNGFFNSLFGQEGVIRTSEGYNYITKDGDIWLYTGMTSAASDESNVGFALVNLRTHEAQFIKTSGADEFSVMASAEGEVLNYGYSATFPILINISDKPYYILSLKDSAGLIKMYALIDARDYQQVYTAKADKDAQLAINSMIASIGGKTNYSDDQFKEVSILIDDIRQAVIEGNTYYYILSGKDTYNLRLTNDNAVKSVFLRNGDTLTIRYIEVEGTRIIQEIK